MLLQFIAVALRRVQLARRTLFELALRAEPVRAEPVRVLPPALRDELVVREPVLADRPRSVPP